MMTKEDVCMYLLSQMSCVGVHVNSLAMLMQHRRGHRAIWTQPWVFRLQHPREDATVRSVRSSMKTPRSHL